MSKIKMRIWGFQKKEVDDHFNTLIKVQEAELEDLTKSLEKCQREKEILRQELGALTERNLSLPGGIQLELALKRVERVGAYIGQDVGIEVLAIDKIYRQKSLLLENTIAEIDKDIEHKKGIIEKELKNIIEIARGEKTQNVNIEVLKSIAKVLPIAEWLKNNKEEQTNFGNQLWGEDPNANSTDKVIPSIQEVAVTRDSEAEILNQDILQQVEASIAQPKGIANERLNTGVYEKISVVRDMDIVGRVAGDDIADSSGKIIIRKDEPITLNIMQLAQEAGKLAELIIHMVLPRQEE